MRKSNVIQLSIIILGLILGLSAIQYLLSGVLNLVLTLIEGDSLRSYNTYILPSLLGMLLQFIICWILITKSGDMAAFIHERTGMDTSFKIVSKSNDLLFILLIVLGFYFLLLNIPSFVNNIFLSFKDRASRNLFETPVNPNWSLLFINLLLPLVLLMFARPIADYFAGNINDEPVAAAESEGGENLLDTIEG